MFGRVLDKGFSKGKPRNLMVSSDMPNVGEKPKKGDKIHKLNEYSSDGDKYMSYIKVRISHLFISEHYCIVRDKYLH